MSTALDLQNRDDRITTFLLRVLSVSVFLTAPGVRSLLPAGADSGIRNNAGDTPLAQAEARGHAAVVELLRSRTEGATR